MRADIPHAPVERRALRNSLLLHIGVLGLILLLPYLHQPPKVEPPRVVEAVLVRANAPAPEAAKPLPVPSPEPKVQPLPDIKAPEPVQPLPKVTLPKPKEKKSATVKISPLPEPKLQTAKPVPPTPIIKPPILKADEFDAEMNALQKQMQDEEMNRLKQDVAKSAAQALSNSDVAIITKYNGLIAERIYRFASWPPSARSGMTVKIRVTILPGGEVDSAIIVKSSGDPSVDASAKAAALKASPLPVPDDPRLFNHFRSGTFTLTVK